jgi:hypothetical protein
LLPPKIIGRRASTGLSGASSFSRRVDDEFSDRPLEETGNKETTTGIALVGDGFTKIFPISRTFKNLLVSDVK